MRHSMKKTEPAPASALPRGFRFAAVNCGLRKLPALDLGLIVSDELAATGAVFTQNRVQAAPVLLCKRYLRESGARVRAVIVNSRNANCSTGPAGMQAAEATAAAVAREARCAPEQVMVCSTGVIGLPLKVHKILRFVPSLAKGAERSPKAFDGFSRAIMTTDTRPKWAAARCNLGTHSVRLLGCAKGAGMIHPNMATMLAYICTDAAIRPSVLQRAVSAVVRTTFNAITVDGDTSTNDTLMALANGAAGNSVIAGPGQAYRRFLAALHKVCHELALQIVADGEGAKRVVEIEVHGAPTGRQAEVVARTIASSPLVKTMFAGGDPNWGRVLAAAGRSGVKFDPDRTDVYLGGLMACHHGTAYPFSEKLAHKRMMRDLVPVMIDLHAGPGKARVWTCDFTSDYIDINASYRT
jgi:glutamate N-acetyltransferase/amino-acid N-acetyltransferase